MNYELTSEKKQIGDITLYRIRCIKTFGWVVEKKGSSELTTGFTSIAK